MNGWILKDNNYQESYQLKETLFSIANGYLGVRGSFEEGVSENIASVRGTYINGFYEKEKIIYGEKLYGFPDNSESILNVINSQDITIKINEQKFSLDSGEVLFFERELNFKTGIASRKIHWKSPLGEEMNIVFKRLISFVEKEVFLIEIEIESLNFEGQIEIVSIIDGDVSNIVVEDDPRIGSSNSKALEVIEVKEKDKNSFVVAKTENSNLTVAAGVCHKYSKEFQEEIIVENNKCTHHIKGILKEGKKEVFTKYTVYTDSIRHGDAAIKNSEILMNVSLKKFDSYANSQEEYLNKFWKLSDIEIIGDDKMQQSIRFNMFHLLQSAGKDEWSNISAKGLSGEGYGGHYFWDTEIYIFPFFLFTNPDLAKYFLNYRYTILDAARTRAKQMGHNIGALYPWRTIAGEECSAFFPAGTAQYHINVDIAYSVIQYFNVTEDVTFIAEKGLEMLLEIARLMYHIGHFRKDGKFCIDAVTGPDEYTCVVNNNYYTNLLTKNLFKEITGIWNQLKQSNSSDLSVISSKIGFKEEELKDFEKAGDAMYLPFDEENKLHPQDDSFFNKKLWDFENTPKENYPLLLNYHPLTLYRHQVCKQADTILGHFLLEEETDLEVIENDFNYYEKITTHDSSLSTCIFSIMANRIGKYEKAYDYFMNTARLDIENLHHNTHNGIHTACMGGSWMSIVFGFAGMRVIDGKLNFRPNLPEKWEYLNFKIKFKNRILNCSLERNDFTINLIEGKPLEVYIDNNMVDLKLEN